MATLACKTRGNTSPQGKPRVYFCCHPADFSLYFETVSDEILALQNCAVFYPEGGEAAYTKELLADLAGMQLFVMPVTTRLLTTANPALEVAFCFALEHHIPVLPLMQERELGAHFNEKCGDLQYLDKQNDDPTAIPYEQKLRQYLDSVLVGDELAAQVRAAFDAYIFLSYRKKDRRYAQELMRLIHANEFCREIAIWYDEFLTPGENFNEAIREALEKSGLFVLAVTPNLVNEVNYIMTIEYPLAVEQGKPILPAEMVATDRRELADKYAGLPPCADAHDPLTLSSALAATLRQLAIRENDSDPRHNFFIGLAYLSGIDVEVDHARAVELIAGAAEAGVEEAIEKLVTMYREGLGVAQNSDEAIRWQKRLVDIREAAYGEEPERALDPLAFALWRLGELYEDTRRWAEAETTYNRLCEVLKRRPTKVGDFGRLVNFMGLGPLKLGCVYYAKGDLEKAKAYLDMASGWPHTANQAVAHQYLGHTCRDLGQLCDAVWNYLTSVKEWKRLADENPTPERQGTLAELYEQLGDMCMTAGSPELAQEWYGRSLPLRQVLAKASDRPQEQQALAECAERIRQAQGASEPERPAHPGALAKVCQHFGDMCKKDNDKQKAIVWYEKEAAFYREETRQTGKDNAWSLSAVYRCLGDLCREAGQRQAAISWYEQSKEVLASSGLKPSHEVLEVLGNLYREIGDRQRAIAYYEQWLAILKQPPQGREREDFARIYQGMGDVYRDTGARKAALDWYAKALSIRAALVKEESSTTAVYHLSIIQNRIGTLYREGENPQEGLVWLERCYTLRKVLLDKEKDSEKYKRALITVSSSLGKCAVELGDACRIDGKKQEAKTYYEKAVNAYETLSQLTDKAGDRKQLAVSYLKLALVWGTGWQDIVRYKALPIAEALHQAYPNDPDITNLYQGALRAL